MKMTKFWIFKVDTALQDMLFHVQCVAIGNWNQYLCFLAVHISDINNNTIRYRRYARGWVPDKDNKHTSEVVSLLA